MLLDADVGYLLRSREKVWSSLFFGDDRQGSVFGELFVVKEETRTVDRAKQIAAFCAPTRFTNGSSKRADRVLVGGKVVKLSQDEPGGKKRGPAGHYMTMLEIDQERKQAAMALEKARHERLVKIREREKARLKRLGVDDREADKIAAAASVLAEGKGDPLTLSKVIWNRAVIEVKKDELRRKGAENSAFAAGKELKHTMANIAQIAKLQGKADAYLKSLATHSQVRQAQARKIREGEGDI
jgi:hypothetical protein